MPRATRLGRVRAYAPRDARTKAIAEETRRYLATLAGKGLRSTVRHLFYHVVDKLGQAVCPKTEEGYEKLEEQTVRMRKGGYIGMDSLIDGTRECTGGAGYTLRPSDYLGYMAGSYSTDRWQGQPEVAALWCEAETHREMLAPVAAAFRVALVVTRGSPSLSLLHTCARAIERRYREGQTTRIVYVGDHDPAGLDMSRRLHERLCELHMPVEACTVERVAVTTIAIVRWALASVIADQEAWEGHEAHDRAEQRRLRAFIREHESEIDSEDDDPDGDEDGEWLGIPH